MASTLKKYTDEYDKINKSALDSQIATVKSTAEKNRNIVNQNYGAKIAETEQSYDDQERINAVQKLINEQEIAENMANLGLTDSGLNRTQQTAVQLSYANNRANIERQKRSAIDSLTREMNAYLTEIETGAESSIASLKDTYNQNRTSYAQAMYKTDVEAAAKAAKEAAKEAKENLGTYNYAYAEKGNLGDIKYRVFEIDGETKKIADGYNPYTRDNNKVKYAYEAENYGFFSNGYQPKGVKGHGAFTGAVGTDNLYGKSQSVWQAEDGTLWYWNGRTNEYELYDITGDGVSNVQDLIRLKKTSK